MALLLNSFNVFNRLNFFLLIFLAVGCGKALPELENIDLKSWKQDKNACGQYRTSVISALDSQKNKLIALDERQVVELLGNPDRNELYKRNQKFYYYYLTPTAECANASPESKRLAIRFNAMGLAKEIAVE